VPDDLNTAEESQDGGPTEELANKSRPRKGA